MSFTATELEEMFGTDQALGIYQDEDGQSLLPNGNAMFICTYVAEYIVEKIGGRVMGFESDENPTSIISRSYGGHDFAIVLDRYIVDPWVKLFENYAMKCVFDLKSDADQQLIRKIYGNRKNWEEIKKALR